MALTKKKEYSFHRTDKYRIRYKIWSFILEDGERIATSSKIFTITPKDDWTVADYQLSGEAVPSAVIAMCEEAFTAAVKKTYAAQSVINDVEGEPSGPSFDTSE